MPSDSRPEEVLPHDPPTAAPTTVDPAPVSQKAADSLSAGSSGNDGSIKETIESILVAFILAFIFRAYIVEAFVIPTGSMAPTLLGAHMRYQCTDCGYRFTVNYSGKSVGDDVIIPDNAYLGPDRSGRMVPSVFGIVCPNCGYQVPPRLGPKPSADNGELLGDSDNDATAPPVYYGDRILVLKYAFLLNEPRRWDVVVFKTPYTPERTVPPFTMNYIKRLAGKPYESLMILDGDVYAAPIDHSTPREMIPSVKPALKEFKIQRKDAVAQSALWRVVSDNDFLPHLRKDWVSPWQASGKDAGGWALVDASASPSRAFHFDNPAGEGWIHFDPGVDDKLPLNKPLTEWLAYDITRDQQGSIDDPDTSNLDHHQLRVRNNVSDLRLSCTFERKSGNGPLRLELQKLDDVFTAEILPASVRLIRHDRTDPTKDTAKEIPLATSSRPVRLDFQNVDYRVSLRVDGDEVLGMEYDPDLNKLMAAFESGQTLPVPQIRIGAARQVAELSHVSLWRDIYYTNSFERMGDCWASPKRRVNLGPDEFFVLGDNSLMSGDARVFSTGVDLPAEGLSVEAGRVPGRFMLGKAFFVYWPAGYRPFDGAPGLIPNFAEMRFIH